MGLTLGILGKNDATGWTTFTVSASGSGEGTGYTGSGSRLVYVSAAGNDTTGTGTQAAPYATPQAGWAQIRNAHADWLLLRKGDTFRIIGDQTVFYINKSGPDAANPIRIGTYG